MFVINKTAGMLVVNFLVKVKNSAHEHGHHRFAEYNEYREPNDAETHKPKMKIRGQSTFSTRYVNRSPDTSENVL